jgi:hypothetical protein
MCTKQERAVTWWNPAAQMRPVLDSSPFFPVPTLPHKLAILLLSCLLFELVAALPQCLCSESNKKNGEVSEYSQQAEIFFNKYNFLITGYVEVRTYVRTIFIVKCLTITCFFFHCLCSALMEKDDFREIQCAKHKDKLYEGTNWNILQCASSSCVAILKKQ